MTRTVFCKKLNENLPGLNSVPYPGPLGQRIFNDISQQAWNDWMKQQTVLINENRLNVLEPKSRALLEKEMERFLFGIEPVNP